MKRALLLLSAFAAGTALAVACVTNPDIDGSVVPKIGTESTPAVCAELCARLERLCGYPPYDCVAICEAEWDGAHRVCKGQSSSCQQALEICANEETDASGTEDAEPAAPDGDAPSSDAGTDTDGPTDAAGG